MNWPVLLCLLLAFALRVWHLGEPTLTNDEWFMLRSAREGLPWIVHQARVFEPHPLLYYAGIALWVPLTGPSEFALRFPSALAGAVLVAAGYRFGQGLAGHGAGLLVAALLALNPYQVAQAQNARNYALVTALATLAGALFVRAWQRGHWGAYTAGMLLALHTHYNAFFIASAHLLTGLWHQWRARTGPGEQSRPTDPQGFWRAQAVLLLTSAAWLAYAAPGLLAYRGYFPDRLDPPTIVGRTLRTFLLGQQPVALPDGSPPPAPALWAGVGLALGLALVGLVAAWRRASWIGQALALGSLVPLGAMALVFQVRPLFEERYFIVLAPVWLTTLALGWTVLARRTPALAGLAALPLVGLTALGLVATYRAPLENRPDYRSLARYVAAHWRPGDLVITTAHGVADLYDYYRGDLPPARVLADPATAAGAVAGLTSRPERPTGVWFLPYWETPLDRAVQTALATAGYPGPTLWFRTARLQYISLVAPTPTGPTVYEAPAGLAIAIQAVGPLERQPGETIGLRWVWRLRHPLPPLKISLRLRDPADHLVAQFDREPLDGLIAWTALPLDHPVEDRAGLPVPLGTPPGPLRLEMVIYQAASGQPVVFAGTTPGDRLTLGTIQVHPADRFPPPEALPVTTRIDQRHGPLRLVGATFAAPPLQAGESLEFSLVWQALGPVAADPPLLVLLTADDRPDYFWALDLSPGYPPTAWRPGEVLRRFYRLTLPPTTPIGTYHLRLAVADAAPLTLGPVVVAGPARSFTPPTPTVRLVRRLGESALLLGYDLSATTLRPGERLRLILYWRALAPTAVPYTVFTHLVERGERLRAQHDGPPVAGTRPTVGWLPGEYLRDVHEIVLDPEIPPGPYRLQVGLYDPRTGDRLPVYLEDGQPAGDRVILTEIQVVP